MATPARSRRDLGITAGAHYPYCGVTLRMAERLPEHRFNSMNSAMILFRTHRDSEFIRSRYEYLRATSGLPVMPVVDRTNAGGQFDDIATLDISAEIFADMGLRVADDVAWRCGDYSLYVARRRFPDVTHFWMIEYDVLFSFEKASQFFSQFQNVTDIDFLAADLRQADASWHWFAAMAETKPIFRCLFPVVRVSAAAIDYLYGHRRALSAGARSARLWPNDEAFVATTLAHSRFRIDDLNCRGIIYRGSSYRYGWNIPAEKMPGRPLGLICHPVLDRSEMTLKFDRSAVRPTSRKIKAGLRHALHNAALFLFLNYRAASATWLSTTRTMKGMIGMR